MSTIYFEYGRSIAKNYAFIVGTYVIVISQLRSSSEMENIYRYTRIGTFQPILISRHYPFYLSNTWRFTDANLKNAGLYNATVLPCHIYGTIFQTWALALFFQVRSPLNFYPTFAIALPLILRIFRFAHRSIALKQTSGSLLERSGKTSIRSYSFDICILL